MKKIIIAIDGPAGSGKTTTAKELSRRLNYIYIDTGAFYRAVTLACLRENLPADTDKVSELMERIQVSIKNTPNGQITLLNGEDVSDEIRTPEVTSFVSPISAMKCVREKMIFLQRELAKDGGVVMDGRDIGTFVFPNAELKIYLIASIDSRAKRRTLEMLNKGMAANEDEIKELIVKRDLYDSTRELNPLTKADDAIEIDTSNITIEEQVEMVYKLAMEII